MTDAPPSAPRSAAAAMLALMAVGGALRLFHLGAQSLWVDEAVALRFARYPLGELLPQMLAHHEVHPPLYDAALHVWSDAAQNEAWIRLPSAVLGTLSIPLVGWLAREVGATPRASLLAAGLFALSAFDVQISQEAKGYALGVFFSLIACALFARMLSRPTRLVGVAYGIACLFGFYTHYLTVLLWPCHLVAAGVSRRPPQFWKSYLAAMVVLAVGGGPWGAVIWHQAKAQDLSLFRRATFGDLAYTPLSLLSGTAWMVTPGAGGTALVGVVLALALAALVAGARALERPPARMLVLSVAVPGIFLFCVSSMTPMHIFWPKYLSFSLGALWVLIACGITCCRPRWLGAVALVVLLALNLNSLRNLYFDPLYQNQDWRSVVGFFISRADEDRDVVVIVPSMMVLPFRYYYPGRAPLIGTEEPDLGALEPRVRGARHVWLCMPPAHPIAARSRIIAWLEAHGRQVEGVRTDSVYEDNRLVLVEYELGSRWRWPAEEAFLP